jgi:hypothetical protein
MYCTKCGGEISTDARFCSHCGAPQSANARDEERSESSIRQRISSEKAAPAAKKPNKSSAGRTVGIVAVVLLVIVLVIASQGKSPEAMAVENNADMLADQMEMQADNLDAMADAVTAKPTAKADGRWSYSTDEDKVRGATTYFASTTSTNTIRQDPPYDPDTSMTMTIRKSQAHGTDVLLVVSSGQLMCPSYEGCSGTVRFDNGPAQRISFSGAADNSSETIFVDGAKGFISKVKKAKRVIIEKTLYQAGNPQFEFDVSGLKWEH